MTEPEVRGSAAGARMGSWRILFGRALNMRPLLILLAVLTAGCEATFSTQSPEPEALAQLSPAYKRPRWQDVVECPGRSKLALHGECWNRVDVEGEGERCSEAASESEDDDKSFRDRGTCPEPKRTFRFGFV